jgi:hypothetical protein
VQELEVEQLELMPILEPSLKNYYDWLHLTPAAARTVARAVASAILRLPHAATRPTAREHSPDVLDANRFQLKAS